MTKIYAFGKYLIENRHLFPTLTEEEPLMRDTPLRPFAYAHSSAIMNTLTTEAKNRRHFISGGYDFLEKPGEHTAFDNMIKLAKEVGGINPLYVDTVKEFAGTSLADFKNALTAIEDAGMRVISAAEPDYNYYHFMNWRMEHGHSPSNSFSNCFSSTVVTSNPPHLHNQVEHFSA
jgi:hypothetical protein